MTDWPLPGVRFRRKSDVLFWRIAGRIVPRLLTSYWTAWRWPFGAPTIYYPSKLSHRMWPVAHEPARPSWPGSTNYAEQAEIERRWFVESNQWIVDHEMHHVRQVSPWYGPPLLLAYICIPWVRWLMERRPYLGDIRAGKFTPKRAAEQLAADYFVCLPRSYMIRWWLRRVGK